MKYLFGNRKKISTLINKAPHIYLFLDYDGTLTPIVSKPELANLPKDTKLLLRKLLKNPKISVVIISGRPIKQLRQKLQIRSIALAGNHGLEIESPALKYIHPLAKKARPFLNDIKNKLDVVCKNINGTFVEDKELTLSVHYRLAKEKTVERLKQYFNAVVNPYIRDKKVKITYGKKVLEIRPPTEWNKGSLVDYLLYRKIAVYKSTLPIYIGDDRTDEDAFKRLRKRGITIFVGRKNSASIAEYYVKNTKEVFKFLNALTTNYKLQTTN